jgi:hypothetical protein
MGNEEGEEYMEGREGEYNTRRAARTVALCVNHL